MERGPVDPPRLVIRASAGTGKTFQLSNRYLALLRHVPPDRILATTFTRKAAGEIRERILLRLAKAALDESEAQKLSAFLGDPPVTRAECRRMLESLTHQLHRLRVETIDGFFARLATVASLELGLSPDWRMLEDVELAQLRTAAVETVLETGHPRDLLELVHLLDAGDRRSGVHKLILEKVTALHDIFVQSPAAAWEQIPQPRFLTAEERAALVEELLSIELPAAIAKARNTDCEKFENDDWEGLFRSGVLKKILNGETKFSSKPIADAALRLYRRMIDHIRAVKLAAWAGENRAARKLLEHFDFALRRHKEAERGAFFNDVTRMLAEAGGDASSVELSHRLDGGITHLLLDEFQDTSVDQWKVLSPFARSVCDSAAGSFFCVGDTKQAIYGWRGGVSTLLGSLADELPDIREQELSLSRRSSPVVMQTVNDVFRGITRHNNLDRFEDVLQTWSRSFPEHQTAREKLPGHVVLRTAPLADDFSGNYRRTTELKAGSLPFTAGYIADLHRQSPQRTIGVLVRKNDTIRSLIFELGRIGVEASEEGGSPLSDSAAVDVILALFTLADHPGNSIARFHVATSPLGAELEYTDYRDDRRTQDLSLDIRRRLLSEGYAAVVDDLVGRLAQYCSPRELRRAQQLMQLAGKYDAVATLRCADFVHHVHVTRAQERSPAPVRVMTIHQSKGLEFDIVVLPELDESLYRSQLDFIALTSAPGQPPELVAINQAQDIRRLAPPEFEEAHTQTLARQLNDAVATLYVALTRAVHSLHMIVQPRQAKAGELTYCPTYAGLLHCALAPGMELSPATVLYEAGDPLWMRHDAPIVRDQAAADDPGVLTIRLAPPDVAKQRGLRRAAPSRTSQRRSYTLEQCLRTGDPAAMARGTLFHRWFEQVAWTEAGQPDAEVLRRIGQELGVDASAVERHLSEFEAMLQSGPISRTLSQASHADGNMLGLPSEVTAELSAAPLELQVLREERFSVLLEGQLLTGCIDRLVLFKREGRILAADVLDYKTDAIDGDDVSAVLEKYHDQLAGYRAAVRLRFNLPDERIATRLVLLTKGRVERV